MEKAYPWTIFGLGISHRVYAFVFVLLILGGLLPLSLVPVGKSDWGDYHCVHLPVDGRIPVWNDEGCHLVGNDPYLNDCDTENYIYCEDPSSVYFTFYDQFTFADMPSGVDAGRIVNVSISFCFKIDPYSDPFHGFWPDIYNRISEREVAADVPGYESSFSLGYNVGCDWTNRSAYRVNDETGGGWPPTHNLWGHPACRAIEDINNLYILQLVTLNGGTWYLTYAEIEVWYRDRMPYDNVGHSTTNAGENCQFTCDWTAPGEQNVSGFIFSTNNTGEWTNDTWVDLGSDRNFKHVETMRTVNTTVGMTEGFRWWCNFTDGSWSDTGVRTFEITSPLDYSGISASNLMIGGLCTFRIQWTTKVGDLSGYIFSTNNTGSWVNDTWTGDFDLVVNSTFAWASPTKTITTTVGLVVGYKWFANNSYNSWGESVTSTFTTTSWLSGWPYRKAHVIQNATGAGSGYQVKITVVNGTVKDEGSTVFVNNKTQMNFDDIRFTSSDGTTLLDYWLESKNDEENATFWVKVLEDLDLANRTIYMYYGNPTCPTISNSTATFTFFDHFDTEEYWGQEVNWDIWNNAGTTQISSKNQHNSYSNITRGYDTHNPWADGIRGQEWTRTLYGAMRMKGYITNGTSVGLAQANQYQTVLLIGNISCYYQFGWWQNIVYPDDGEHLYEIQWASSGVGFLKDDLNVGNGLRIPEDPLVPFLLVSENYSIQLDWVLIRKCVLPEPVQGEWDSVRVESNVTVTDETLSTKGASFFVSGYEGQVGYANVTIPVGSNTTDIAVLIDGAPVSDPFPLITTDGLNYFVYFEFNMSTHNVVVEYANAYNLKAIGVTSNKTVAAVGSPVSIQATLKNEGDVTESFTADLLANATLISSVPVTLLSGESKTIDLLWNTTGFDKGHYVLSVRAEAMPGEYTTADNTVVGNELSIAMVGDITGPVGWPDGKVDVRDVARVSRLFGVNYPNPKYEPNCDFNDDLKIDVRDIAIVSRHFGEVDH